MKNKCMIFTWLILCLMAPVVSAGSIEVLNFGFEDPPGGHQIMVQPTDWELYPGTDYGLEDPGSEGSQCGYLGGENSYYQLLSHIIEAGDEITLKFDGSTTYTEEGPVSFQGKLYYDNSGDRIVLGTVSGTDGDYTWDTYQLNCMIDNGSPAIGHQLGVLLYHNALAGSAKWAGFDNVQVELQSHTCASNPTPADGQEHVDPSTVVLSWDAPDPVYVTNPTYNLYLATDPNLVYNLVTIPGLTTPSYTPSLDYGVEYFWRVDVIAAGGPYVGDIWSFTTGGKATEPIPADGAGGVKAGTVDLSWTGDTFATSYKLYFGTNPVSLTYLDEVTDTEYPGVSIPDELTSYYWRVDEYSGTTLLAEGDIWTFMTGGLVARLPFTSNLNDISGRGHHATAYGNAAIVDGALALDGDGDYVVIGPGVNEDELEAVDDFTWSIWINTSDASNVVIYKGDPLDYWTQVQGAKELLIDPVSGIGGTLYFDIANDWRAVWPAGRMNDSTWHHLAVTCQMIENTVKIYADGVECIVIEDYADVQGPAQTDWHLVLGAEPDWADHDFLGSMSDFRIYAGALTIDEIKVAMSGGPIASNPVPADGAVNVPRDTMLSWTGAETAASHILYFAPADANLLDNPIPLTVNTYDPTPSGGLLGIESEYQWRVDEVDGVGGIKEGQVWKFTTVPYKAYNPIPEDNATEVPLDVILQWTGGEDGPYEYSVYFGTNPATLTKVESDYTEDYYDPGTLDWGIDYYWRIDEELKGSQVIAGDTWHFTTIVPVCDPPLTGDTNDDCAVDMIDLAEMCATWLDCNFVPDKACP